MRNPFVLLFLTLVVGSAGAQIPVPVIRETLKSHLLSRAPLSYSVRAESTWKIGTVVTVGPNGVVVHMSPQIGPSVLTSAAEKSIARWHSRPFLKKGKAVPVTGPVRVTFALDKQPELKAFFRKVRAKYASEPGLVTRGFSCAVKPEWGEIPEIQHLPSHAAIAGWLKKTKLYLTVNATSGLSTTIKMPRRSRLTIEQLKHSEQLVDGLRQMLRGFYLTWLPFGVDGPGAPPGARMQQTSQGTNVEFRQNGATDHISFDKSLLVTHFDEQISQNESLNEKPHYTTSPAGWLYTGIDYTLHNGAQMTHVIYRITYQGAGLYRLPKTVEIQVNQSFHVHLRFQKCVLGKKTTPASSR